MNATSNSSTVAQAKNGAGVPFKECQFEFPQHLIDSLKGTIRAEFYEDGGNDPVDILHCTQDAWVIVTIDLTACGPLARMFCGYWCVCVGWESCGLGPEETKCEKVEFKLCESMESSVKVRLPKGTFPCKECGTVYCLCVSVTAMDCNNQPVPIAGFCKPGCIVVYP